MLRAGMYGTKKAYTLDHAFLNAHNVAVFEDVLGKVDVGRTIATFHLLDGLSTRACVISTVVDATTKEGRVRCTLRTKKCSLYMGSIHTR